MKVRFQGHHIEKGIVITIERAIEFVNKFLDFIKDKTQH